MVLAAFIFLLLTIGEGSLEASPFRASLLQTVEVHSKLIGLPTTLASSDESVNVGLKLCDEMIIDSLDSLKETVQSLHGFGELLTDTQKDELRGKLSYALVDHDTCLDAFEELDFSTYRRNEDVIKTLKDSLRKGRQLVSKCLRLLSKGLSKGLPKLDERSFPYWFGPEDQKSLLTCQWIPNVTVASDGTGDFLTISEAVVKVPESGSSKFVIHVKGGFYPENVILPPKKSNVVMFGDGNTKTIVSASLNRLDNPLFTTFQTATFSVRGRGFVAMDMKFVNTAGPEKNQAVAFHSMSTFSVMYRCTFEGFQDTLYAHAGDQLYRECDIVGTVDFIFGYSAAIFQRCNILSRKPLPNQINTITAQAASDQFAKSGFVIVNSTIGPYLGEHFTTYLGRPWKPFATVLVMKTYLGDIVEPRGWIAWNKEAPPTTLRYGEFKNSGPGSGLGSRVNWTGYEPSMTEAEAQKYSVDIFINQDGWLNQTCIPYDSYV
ncbi:PREDICTED: pectinesterase-like [Brassica oleracea var. oleracea]|uniref:Pectinesterase n=1 Tax=Brassica oleracea var. oleracea TaxID=109376 RepID=A0A0D3ADQ8_BRAOL|nr:PREDICTED: pectinesterase-like [Brassica oleracea var. oleracea]